MNADTLYYRDYSGGLHDTASPREIERTEASLLRNWDITYKGQLRRRNGLIQKGNTIHATNPILGLHGFLRSNGAKDLLAMNGTSLYYLNSSTWTQLDSGFSGSNVYSLVTCPLNDKVYISNEDNTTHAWDRAGTTLNGCLDDLGNTKYNANIMVWHKNHMFFLNNLKVGATAYTQEIGWSAIGDPETHDTTDDRTKVPGDGRPLTARGLGNSLIIFKERSIQVLTGWGNTSWRITATSSNYGNVHERTGICGAYACTTANDGNEVWFMDNEGQIRVVTRTDEENIRLENVSRKIQGTLSELNKQQLSKVRAWSSSEKVYFAVPNGSSTTNNLVLVYDITASRRTQSEAWTTYTGWDVSYVTDYLTNNTPDIYIGGATTGKVWVHDGDDDDGVAIDARWDGKDDDFDQQERFKVFKFGYITGTASSGDVDVGVYASVDGANASNLGNLNLLSSGSRLGPTGTDTLGPTGNFTLGGNTLGKFKFYFSSGGGQILGNSIMMSLRHDVANEQPVISTYSVHYKLRKLR